MVVAKYLRKLPEDRVKSMYKDATSRETVFRNVLLTLADSNDESTYFKDATIDDIFDKHVRTEGYVKRISNYKLGPSESLLGIDELMIYIQTSGPSWEKKYKILEDDKVKFIENISVSMH